MGNHQSYMNSVEFLKDRVADLAAKLETADARTEAAKADAYKKGMAAGTVAGRAEVLNYLIEVAMRTEGAGVWRALFTAALKGNGAE